LSPASSSHCAPHLITHSHRARSHPLTAALQYFPTSGCISLIPAQSEPSTAAFLATCFFFWPVSWARGLYRQIASLFRFRVRHDRASGTVGYSPACAHSPGQRIHTTQLAHRHRELAFPNNKLPISSNCPVSDLSERRYTQAHQSPATQSLSSLSHRPLTAAHKQTRLRHSSARFFTARPLADRQLRTRKGYWPGPLPRCPFANKRTPK